MKKKQNKFSKKIIIPCIIFVLIFISAVCYHYSTGIEITLLSPQTSTQMMGFIIKTSNNKVVIIDGGTRNDSDNLLSYINKYGGKVDYWFMTHPHMDHVGAFEEIAAKNNVEIKNVILSINEVDWVAQNDSERIQQIIDLKEALSLENIKNVVREPSIGEKIDIDNLQVEILGIKNPEIITNAGNNSSMVMKLYIHNKSILILGDTGVESGHKLMQSVPDKLKSDYVQMAHHGQKGADESFYKIVSPKYCFWPTPEWLWKNDPGQGEDSGIWKTKETRKWMEDLKVKENYVAKDGDRTLKIW